MSEQPFVRNEFSGEATAPVVQAGSVDRIIVNPPPLGLPPEDLEAYRGLLAREVAKANAEDAAALALQVERAERDHRRSRARRRRGWYWLFLVLCWGAGAAYVVVNPFEVPSLGVLVSWTAVMGFLFAITARTMHEARTGERMAWAALFR